MHNDWTTLKSFFILKKHLNWDIIYTPHNLPIYSVQFNVSSCVTNTTINFRTLPFTQQPPKNSCSSVITLLSSTHPWPYTTANLLSVSVDLSIMDISHKWKSHNMRPFSSIKKMSDLFQTFHSVFKVHSCWITSHDFISFRCQMMFHHVERPHLFIHSSVDGHSPCFHFLAIINVNDAAENISRHASFLLGTLVGSRTSQTLYVHPFEELPLFSKVVCHFTLPPAMYKSSSFSTSPPRHVLAVVLTIAILVSVNW